MGVEREIQVPDIGDFDDVDVIEVLVAPGDRVEAEQSLIVLESDKATMEIPSPVAGVVKELLVRVGDKVSEGSPIARIDVERREAREPSAPRATAPRGRGAGADGGAAEPAAPAQRRACDARARSRREPAPGREPAPHRETAAAPSAAELPRSYALAPEDLEEAPPRARAPTRAPRCGASRASSASTSRCVPAERPEGPHPEGRRAGLREERARGGRRRRACRSRASPSRAAPEIDFAKFGPTELQPLNRVRKLSRRRTCTGAG